MKISHAWLFAVVAVLGCVLPAAADPPTGPEARATRKAERWARREAELAQKPPRPMELRKPLPLPVEVTNPSTTVIGGKPAGAACVETESCELNFTPAAGEALILTAVWSATKVQCDDLTSAAPRNGTPIAPWWRCERRLLVQGPGAGYAGFRVTR